MAVELTERLRGEAQSVNQRITKMQTDRASFGEVDILYTNLGLEALKMGGGYSGKDEEIKFTSSEEPVEVTNPNSQIALIVSRAVVANKASYTLHQAMGDESDNFSPEQQASFEDARENIAWRLGHQIIKIALGS